MNAICRFMSVVVALAGATALATAAAEVKAAAPDGLRLEYAGEMPLPRADAWKRLVSVSSWWLHTYSGDISSMSLDAKAGGCWCETWDGGSVEHGRVLAAMPPSMLRIAAPLGPLQAMGANAVMTIDLSDGKTPNTTSVRMTMNVVGSSLSGLDNMAVGVDGVLAEAFAKLVANQ